LKLSCQKPDFPRNYDAVYTEEVSAKHFDFRLESLAPKSKKTFYPTIGIRFLVNEKIAGSSPAIFYLASEISILNSTSDAVIPISRLLDLHI